MDEIEKSNLDTKERQSGRSGQCTGDTLCENSNTKLPVLDAGLCKTCMVEIQR